MFKVLGFLWKVGELRVGAGGLDVKKTKQMNRLNFHSSLLNSVRGRLKILLLTSGQ